MMERTDSLIPFLHRVAQLTREDLWGDEPPYRPKVREEFSQFPRLGAFGSAYSKSRWVLVGTNPGSTESANVLAVQKRYYLQDRDHIRLMENFRKTGNRADFEKLNNFEMQDIGRWHLDWGISGSLKRLGFAKDDVVICNVIPFSTRNAPRRSSVIWGNSVRKFFEPLIEILAPKGIVWLGRSAQAGCRKHLSTRIAEVDAVVSRQRNLPLESRFRELDCALEKMT